MLIWLGLEYLLKLDLLCIKDGKIKFFIIVIDYLIILYGFEDI